MSVTFEIWTKIIGIFPYFLLNIYMKAFISQEHILLPDCTIEPLTYVSFKKCMSGFSVFILDLSKSGTFCLDQCQMQIGC